MALQPRIVDEYHVFLASPGDMDLERQEVRRFFEEYNRTTARQWRARFVVIDWENYATTGVGRPQELITNQTLSEFRDSLALVIGLMGQRFGSPTGTHESGTEEEFELALASNQASGFPEIKWFFRRVEQFVAPSTESAEILAALKQWERVQQFKKRLQQGRPNEGQPQPPLFYKEFKDSNDFKDMLRQDLSLWLSSPEHRWAKPADGMAEQPFASGEVSRKYYQRLIQDFEWLDIAGIDNDRAFRIPLSEMYVRLRVMLDEDAPASSTDDVQDSGPINIQTALEHYQRLVIVGDPGSGKSTFLKFIALMIARSVVEDNSPLAFEMLSLKPPLPVPIFVSCWDLSDSIRQRGDANTNVLAEFIARRFTSMDSELSTVALGQMLDAGSCCLLFDGLDEVPTEQGRALVSRLFEEFVAKYPRNRYVITSRVRAYTGDTMLRGEFARCDIQEFNREDRVQFLTNWFALLFQVSRETVSNPGSDSFKAFEGLLNAIEHNDRIRSLCVNPLLLTVVAIVHWNRKRLPEQRVDLYDECVDVLLGQRREAEHAMARRSAEAFDESKEDQSHDDRTWTRKRFAEIALQILRSEDEELTKQRVVEILRPRFMDRGAPNEEQADFLSELFLARQELRSGLLVSRHSNRYRFVHLAFQEYLAAWNLATQNLSAVKEIIKLVVREQRWFETLQLLGGALAKRSDEDLDEYIAYLLQLQGGTIAQQAPIIALCANILNDVSGVGQVKPNTRQTYNDAIRGTLQAFHRDSRVPAKTQLEILGALAQLGATVKDHLISATNSGHYAVRSRAIAMLVPHLPDDDLFGMTHILHDRSQETIRTYLSSLLDRDPLRTENMLVNENQFADKACHAISVVAHRLLERHQPDAGVALASDLLDKMDRSVFTSYAKSRFLHAIIFSFPQHQRTWALVSQRALEDTDSSVRGTALHLLAGGRKDDKATWELITQRAREDPDGSARGTALRLLAGGRKDDSATWELITQHAREDPDGSARGTALRLLAGGRKDDSATWEIMRSAYEDKNYSVRIIALELLATYYNLTHVMKVILTRDLDALYPYIDPIKPIDQAWVEHCAIRLRRDADEIRDTFKQLAEFLPLTLEFPH